MLLLQFPISHCTVHGTSRKLTENHCYYGVHDISQQMYLLIRGVNYSCTVARDSISRCTHEQRVMAILSRFMYLKLDRQSTRFAKRDLGPC